MLHARPTGRQVRGWMIALLLGVAVAGLQPGAAHAARSDDLATADQLARSGQHSAAAELYESRAKRLFRGWDPRIALLAAREYRLAGRLDDAERMIAEVAGKASGDDAVLLGRVQAEIALERGRPAAALDALAAIPEPWPAPLAVELLGLRATAEFGTGQMLAGIRSLEERARLLGTADARQANYSTLVDALLANPSALASMPAGASASEQAWIELAQLMAAAQASPSELGRLAAAWRTRHPHHPGTAFLPEAAATRAPAAGQALAELPTGSIEAVALLLPLTGRYQAAGEAVRDGFIAAALAQPPERRPRIKVYDTSALGARAAYERAVFEGARAVAGPLTKEDVGAVVAAQTLPVPTLALNSIAGGMPPAFLFQFSLDPEQEARAVARRIAEDGRTRGIALFPSNDWGTRVHDAFTTELAGAGVELMAARFYDPADRDFSGPLRAALGRFGGAGDRDSSGSLRPRDAEAEARDGPQFAFFAANSQAARALKPQLRFQMAYELPVYATSDAWEPGTRSAPDLEGMTFPEMPWILQGGAGAPAFWDVLHGDWAASARGRLRLYAFGYDAYRLLRSLDVVARGLGVGGLTGELTMTTDGQVLRRTEWAQIRNGQPEYALAPIPLAEPGVSP